MQAIIESLLLGGVVVGSFTILPLYRLEEFKPSFIFRKEMAPLRKGWPYYLILTLTFIFFVGLVLWELRDMKVGLYFVGGVIALILITTLITELILVNLKRTAFARLSDAQALPARQALRGLFRPGNATRPIIITLAASLAVIFAIFLIERNLDATFIQSYPEDAPNLFFLDIQPDQVEPFGAALNIETVYYPVVRGNITAINDQAIDRQAEADREEDNLARPFNLTYRDALLEDEVLQTGDGLFRPDWQEAQVSILDDILELHPFQVGDVITFKIQGVPLKARIASIRSAREDSVQPIFNFVFPEAVLKDLPQTVFTAVTVDKSQIAPLQNKIVARFPNISVIDVTEAIATFGDVVRKISRIIRFFTLFSILAGVLIVVSSIFATRFARIQEAVYFKVLGATGRFVLQVFALENIFLGLISALLGLLLSQIGSWIITTQVFEIDYRPFLGASLALVLATILLVTSVGMLASISILKQKPIAFLREQNET
jgi:putative ABC transport system permease protein